MTHPPAERGSVTRSTPLFWARGNSVSSSARERRTAGHRPALRGRSGVSLIECIVYIAVVAVLLGLATSAFFHCWDDSKRLRRNAEDIARALQAGEQWRADIRAATGSPSVIHQGNFDLLTIPAKSSSINYYFFNTQGAVSRQIGTGNAVPLLERVRSSRMEPEPRSQVSAWRWELQLASDQKKIRMQPLFTFETVAGATLAQ